MQEAEKMKMSFLMRESLSETNTPSFGKASCKTGLIKNVWAQIMNRHEYQVHGTINERVNITPDLFIPIISSLCIF